jgi:ribosomal protein S18 acetylase RimI-like enzyme
MKGTDQSSKHIPIRRAEPFDIDQLLPLYFSVYGPHYPLSFGKDRASMLELIENPKNLWYVALNPEQSSVVASCIFEVDAEDGIARVQGLVVHPEFQKQGLATKLLDLGTTALSNPKSSSGETLPPFVHCLYATTRTNSVGPQKTFLKNGFVPLGLLPNSRRLQRYETLTLMARYAPSVLELRKAPERLPEPCYPLYKIVDAQTKNPQPPQEVVRIAKPFAVGPRLEFEMILAPDYVERKFNDLEQSRFDRFYPFHKPNLLMSAKNGEVDIFAYFNEQDGYCTLISSTQPLWTLGGRLRPLMESLRDFGAAYLETLLASENLLSIESLLDVQFLPSAYFPALYKEGDQVTDMVLMTRTMEPLNFHGMEVDKSFKPYLDQYVSLWKKMHLDVLSIFQD